MRVGSTRDHVESIEMVLASGQFLLVGDESIPQTALNAQNGAHHQDEAGQQHTGTDAGNGAGHARAEPQAHGELVQKICAAVQAGEPRAHISCTITPQYRNMADGLAAEPRAVRYAAFNVADNIATYIRQDTSIRPVLFVIGLNQPSGEPLDADWLGRVANDPSFRDSSGNSVFQTGQTSGMYMNVSASGLQGAFQEIASQILRLAQ
jgi:hypothetical protein